MRGLCLGLRSIGRLIGLVLILALAAPAFAADEQYEIFRPLAPAAEPPDFAAALRGAGLLAEGQGLDALAPGQRAAVAALEAATLKPSMATSVGLLAHFETFAAEGNANFRLALIEAARPVFLMAEAAKFELVLATNKRIQATERGRGAGRGIAVSLRVGSTGLRFAQWQQWVAAGRPVDGAWTFTDPNSGQTTTFQGLPIDQAYQDAKLFRSDDDVTNWASAEMRAADPSANESINGARAAQDFAAVTAEILRDYPEEFREPVLGGRASVGPGEIKVEFLSPTQAVKIMGTRLLREARGWSAPIRLEDKVHFLGEWILADPEKYNGLYAEEQLHAWGMANGYVTEDVAAPLAAGSSKTYRESAEGGVLKDITGSDVFPEGVKDPFGWMATNYRQIFVTHKGDLDSVAKYTLRMIDWWTNVNLTEAELRALGAEVPELAAVAGDFDRLKALASSIRNAESAALKDAAIRAVGGTDAALAELRGLNELMMVAGQRKHLAQASEALTRILQADAAERSPEERATKPLTLDDILARARGEREGGGPYADFETVIDAFANGYANLPEEAAKTMAGDIAGGVERALAEAEGAGQIDAATRVALLPVLRDGAMRARAVGTDMQADASGLAAFADIARSDLGEAINRQLVDLGEPDLNLYLLELQRGGVRRRVARILPGELDGGGWPRIQQVDEIARPAEVAADLKRIMWLGEKLGWSDQDFARRMAAYFNGPDYRQPLAEGEVGEASRSYADDAMETYLGFARLFDRSASTTRFVTYTGPDGEEVTVQIEGSRFADAEIHLGYLVFQQTLRGAEGAARLWGIKGDIESIATLGRTMHSLAVDSAGMDEAARAKAFATMAAEAYGGFTGLAEKFASNEWQETLERHIGKESLLIGKAGGTITAMLKTADDLMQSPESQEAVFGAMAKDLLIVWNPHMATVLAVHAMYKAGESYLVNEGAKNDFLDLLVRNGEWTFADDGTPPVLERVLVNNVWYDDDEEARKNQCLSRAANAMPPEGTAYRAIGLEHLVKIPPASLAGGTPLCKAEGEGCVPEPDRMVKPREAILTLFYASPHATTDPVLLAAKDAIDDRVGWEYLDAVRRVLTWDDGSKWTAERLASHGIYPPTPEDGSGIVREPVRLDEAGSLSEIPRDVDRQWVHAGIWRSLSAGGRRALGFSSSEYWVRRQYIIECVMLDPLIKEAGRRAQKESFTGVEAPEIRDRLAELDARVRSLDARVWPNIAASADPYRPTGDGEVPDEQKLAIYAHYLQATANQRRDLRDILAWFEGGSRLDAVPFDVLSRTYAAESFLGAEPGFDAVEQLPGLAEADEAARKAGVAAMLARRATATLSSIADVVAKYEDGFDGALSRLAAMRKYVSEGNDYDIMPAHVALMPVESFAPPEGGFGEVRNHLFPEGEWAYPGLTETRMEDALLTARNLLAGGFAAEGSLGAAVREWEDRYKTARDEARDELGAVLDGFRTTLAQDLGYWDLQIDVEDRNPFAGIFEEYAGDLAERHPMWKRLLRQRFQMVKIDLVAEQGARVAEAEATAVALGLKRDAPNVAVDWQGKGASDLVTLRALFAEDAARIVRRSENLFDLELKVEAEGPMVVSNLARGAVTAKPFAGPEDPVITEDEVKAWSERNYWELVRDPDFQGPIRPPVAAAAPAGEGEAALQTATATTEVCDASRPDRDWEAAVWFRPEPPATRDAITWPLATPGAFKARVTITGRGGVPLARATVPLEVAPAELRGELKLEGGPIEPDVGESLLGYVEGSQSERPEFPLYREGPFRTQLCGALSQYLIETTAEVPGLKDAATAAGAMEVYGLFLPVPNAPASDIARGGPVGVENVALGQFALKEPLEITLPRIRDVPVSVKVTDVLDTELAGAESTILYRDARLEGPGPRELVLKDGDVLGAEARLETPGGVAEGSAEEHVFDRAVDLGGVELGVELPVYAERNFAASGRFVLQGEDVAGIGGIDGGTIWSNILARLPETIPGAEFEIENLDVALLSNGLSLDALLRGADEIQSLLVPQTVRLSPLPRGGVLDLGEIPVRRYTTAPVEMRATVSDWAGRRIDAPAAEVTLSDTPLVFADGIFRGEVSFRGYAERLEVKATVDLPDGSKAERLAELTLGAIGDPLNPSPPAPVALEVPVYLPGSLRLVGSFALEGAAADAQGTLDVELALVGGGAEDPWTARPGERFAFDLSFPVRPGMRVAVRAKGEVEGTSYEGEAEGLVPIQASGLPTLLDLGTITLRETGGLFAVPNLVGRDADKAVEEFGQRFTINVLRPKSTEDPAEAGQIFVQTPPPHEPGAPSRLPEGGVITAGAYRKAERLLLPDYQGWVGTEAQGELLGMGVIATLSDGPAAGPGEEPGRVASQAPPGGTEIDPAREQVVLRVWTETQTVAEPEPEPEPPPPPPPPPPAAEVLGGYVGTLRLSRVEIVSNEPQMPFSLDCTTFDACAPRWVDVFAASARRAIEQIERERRAEEREQGGIETLPAIPGEIIEDVLSEIGVAIALGIGQVGVVVMDMLFRGIDVGVVVERAVDGTMFVRLPGAEAPIQKVLDQAVVGVDETGAVRFTVSRYVIEGMDTPIDLAGRLVPQAEGVALELRISAAEAGTASHGALSFVGDFAPGEVGPRPLFQEKSAEITAAIENPSGRIATVSRPLLDLQKRFEEE